MTRRQMDRFEMLKGVRDLLRAKPEQLLTAPAAVRQMPVLEAAVERLEQAWQQQMLAEDQRRSTRGVARRRLVGLMTEMAALARIVEQGTSAAFVQFKLPRPQTDHRIRTTAHLFLELAEPMEQQFVDHGFHAVRADLQARIDDFDRAVQRGDTAARNSAAAQAVIADALDDRMRAGISDGKTLAGRTGPAHPGRSRRAWLSGVDLDRDVRAGKTAARHHRQGE